MFSSTVFLLQLNSGPVYLMLKPTTTIMQGCSDTLDFSPSIKKYFNSLVYLLRCKDIPTYDTDPCALIYLLPLFVETLLPLVYVVSVLKYFPACPTFRVEIDYCTVWSLYIDLRKTAPQRNRQIHPSTRNRTKTLSFNRTPPELAEICSPPHVELARFLLRHRPAQVWPLAGSGFLLVDTTSGRWRHPTTNHPERAAPPSSGVCVCV